MAVVATKEYRSVVFPGTSLCRILPPRNSRVGSDEHWKSSIQKKTERGIESLRAIPWIFAWTQTRFHLPVWLGFGAAMKHVIDKDIRNLQMLKDMYREWPFFRVTIDLIEMVLAKGDPGIAALYDKLLVAGHKELLEGDPYLRQRLRLRDPYITVLNVCQIYTLKRIRDPSYNVTVGPHLSKEIMEMDTSKPADELVKLNPTSEYAPGLEDTYLDHEGYCCRTAEHWLSTRRLALIGLFMVAML
ncbi:UNVERIFIED_CONTAM: Phosphoenolpyruvate carboxylase 1 [Sesamum radiatum]|uniref:Phosphoenolpyruvate carboxylase 1 n=1 Tax=Sesamum radiatum TaxID=300843 RepID=A0AAW2KKH9_SESRA